MSPGTICSAGISVTWPPRRTLDLTIIIFCKAATLASALPSWRNARKRVEQRQHHQQKGRAPLLDKEAGDGSHQQEDLHRDPCTGAGRQRSPVPSSLL